MIDNHVHVGWYSDGYHSPKYVWESEQDAGIHEIVVSSTSTCAELYKLVIREMLELKRLGGFNIHPVLWLTPRMLKTWGIRYMLHSKVKWQGVKMHWEAHHEWYYNHKLVEQAMKIVEQLNVPLLLHTGDFKECKAKVFMWLIEQYPHITFVLAHGRPIDQTVDILKEYANVFVDTSFMNVEEVKKLIANGLISKVLFGTDVPINLIYYKDISTADYLKNSINEIKTEMGEKNLNIILNQTVYK